MVCEAVVVFDIHDGPLQKKILPKGVLPAKPAAALGRALATWFGVAEACVHVQAGQEALRRDPADEEDEAHRRYLAEACGRADGSDDDAGPPPPKSREPEDRCCVVRFSVTGQAQAGVFLAALQAVPADAVRSFVANDVTGPEQAGAFLEALQAGPAARLAEACCLLLVHRKKVLQSRQKVVNPAVRRRAAEALFAEFDEDKDGELSFAEFQQLRGLLLTLPGGGHEFRHFGDATSEMQYHQLVMQLDISFKQAQISGGGISELSLAPTPARITRDLFLRMEEQIDRLWERIRVKRAMDELFSQYDRNKDGVWDFAEAREFFRVAAEAGLVCTPLASEEMFAHYSGHLAFTKDRFSDVLIQMIEGPYRRRLYLRGSYARDVEGRSLRYVDQVDGEESLERLRAHTAATSEASASGTSGGPPAAAGPAPGPRVVAAADIPVPDDSDEEPAPPRTLYRCARSSAIGGVLFHNSRAADDFWEGPPGESHGVHFMELVEPLGPPENGWLAVEVPGAGVKYLPLDSFMIAPDLTLKRRFAEHLGRELGGPPGCVGLRGFGSATVAAAGAARKRPAAAALRRRPAAA